eukprot:CAMPEP_0170300334 /NCGR_PEP_ID=MMETSP0116_2-20130129/50397_1 /TAXON_ID=400756 /ORGANISM="Durinskia baltica, Strain CSIRO CS-38" /LENGTH=172 /DNA_ID=CAMNT_0010552097 /DNA_START=204 /DNA_END=718 /DNA_ORIENTATION=-
MKLLVAYGLLYISGRPFCHAFVPSNRPWAANQNGPSIKPSIHHVLSASAYEVAVDNSGPGGSPVHTLTIHNLPGDHLDLQPIVLQTGKIGRQAAGAITLTRGDTVLYATAAREEDPREGLDFLPLSVEHQERFSAVGMTSGGYNKRDGRPAEHEVLTCRLIDRPIRPLIAQG